MVYMTRMLSLYYCLEAGERTWNSLVFTVYPNPRCDPYGWKNPRKCFCKTVKEGRLYRIEDKKKAQDLQEIKRLEYEADSMVKSANIIAEARRMALEDPHPKPSPSRS
jgi:hypothetical protein